MNLTPTINPYPDEPHPNDEFVWKQYWVKKFFEPKDPLSKGEREWIHQCWQTTKALWNSKDKSV